MTKERFWELFWCRLGFHDWGKSYIQPRITILPGEEIKRPYDTTDSECQSCHKIRIQSKVTYI